MRADPDLVMAAEREVRTMRERPGWSGLRALHGHACGFAPAAYDLIVRPGPRMGEAAGLIADCVARLDAGR